MIPRYISLGWQGLAPALKNHLWQSTLFLIIAALLTLVLRKNQARTRYWLWLAASLKFLVPLSLLVALGSHLAVSHRAVATPSNVYIAMDEFSQPFAPETMPQVVPLMIPKATSLELSHLLPRLLAIAWFAGFATVLCVWSVYWRRISAVMQDAVPIGKGRELEALHRLVRLGEVRGEIRMLSSTSSMEPGIFGIFRPVLIWPTGISHKLGDRHLEAILAHEVCHVRRRDNLTAAAHMLVEAIFWFHPLVWWLGARLLSERERACDEEVLRLCVQPEIYAEGILKVCEFCLESPLPCVSGVTGSDLKKRIVNVLSDHMALRLDLWKKLLLLMVGFAVVAVPIVLGQMKAAQRLASAMLKAAPAPLRTMAHAMMAEEQTPSNGEIVAARVSEADPADPCAATDGAKFDVVSIRPSKASRGDWDSEANADGVLLSGTAKNLIQEAFGLRDFQVVGGPDWVASDTFDIKAKFDRPDEGAGEAARKAIAVRWAQRYRSLLQERFQFKCHMTTKELPVYDLVIAKGGPKLKPTTAAEGSADSDSSHGDSNGIHTVATGLTTQGIATMLARFAGRTVLDKTGLTGRYDLTVNWKTEKQAKKDALDGEAAPLPELPTALEEQVGLKLVPSKGPVPVLVIDHVEKPTMDGAASSQSDMTVNAPYVPTQPPAVYGMFMSYLHQADAPAIITSGGFGSQQDNLDDLTVGARIDSKSNQDIVSFRMGWAYVLPSGLEFDRGETVVPYNGLHPRGTFGVPEWRVQRRRDATGFFFFLEEVMLANGTRWEADRKEILADYEKHRPQKAEVAPAQNDTAPMSESVLNQQSTTRKFEYAVATIKPNHPGEWCAWKDMEDGFTARCQSVQGLIMNAYGPVQQQQIVGLPDWAKGGGEGFEVAAKMDDDTIAAFAKLTPEQQRDQRQHMLQTLLADRLGLKVHRETRQMPIYLMTVVTPGKLTLSDPKMRGRMSLSNSKMNAHAMTIDNLEHNLGNTLGRMVIDQTGLKGTYDFTLEWAPQGADASDPRPSIFAALEEQLGLKLKPAQGSTDVIVVDAIRQPSEN